MASTDRKTEHHLAGLLGSIPENLSEMNFFQVLRLIECLYTEKPRLGTSRRPADDPIRLAQAAAMTFESASLSAFEPGEKGKPNRLTVRFLGLLGPNAPLPLHLTEYAQERQLHHKDHTFARFLDIFHHRMLSLFYRAWANNEPAVSFDRPESDRFSDFVGSLAGLGMSKLRRRDDISDLTKRHYCGWLSLQTKCAEGLQAILTDYFRMKADVEEFTGDWLPLPEKCICRLGADPSNGTLGQSAIVGLSIWDCQHKFRILMGSMGYPDYQSMLPTGNRIRRLVALVRNYVGDELGWDVRLVLKREEVPATHLDGNYQLGWTTWLGERPEKTDADDLILNAFAYVNYKP